MRYRQHDGGNANDRMYTWLSLALVAAGIALRLWQFLGRSALWTDEAAIATNIVARPFAQLVSLPLGHNQAAPIGFLAIEKLAVSMLGTSELALRAYPLACALLSMLLLWRLASHLLPAGAIPLALAPFAFAPPLIFHAAEVKQYSSDVVISLALLLVALELSDRAAVGQLSARRIAFTAMFGAVAVWLSQPAVLVVAGLGGALAIGAIGALGARGRRPVSAVAWIIGAWAASALAATVVSMRHLTPDAHQFMLNFWSDGFWPLSLRHPSSVIWPVAHIALLIGSQLGIPTSAGLACALLAMGGIVATWKSEWRTSLLLVLPIFVALGASAARLYPFAERLALFLLPSLLLLAAIGVAEIGALARTKRSAALMLATATGIVVVVSAQALYGAPPVYRREEITPAISYLRRASRATDASYVYYGGVPAYDFYDAREPLPARATRGGCHRGEADAYLAELDRLRGAARVWLLFAHELPRLGEREMMLAHLDSIGGSLRDSVVVQGRDASGNSTFVRLYLYDLSAAARVVPMATARAHTVSASIEKRLQCAPVSD